MKIKLHFFILLVFLATSFLLWLFYKDDLFLQLWVFSVLLVIFSYFSGRYSLKGLEIKRSSRYQKMSVGNYFEDYFEITNKNRFWKLWLEIEDLSGISGNEKEVRVISSIPANRTRTFTTFTFLKKRGVYSLGPLIVHSSDIFGFFEYSKKINIENTLVVLPRIEEIDSFTHLPAYMTGGKELKLSSIETTPFAAGVREYHPGDTLRRIHWPTTARMRKLMVKEFDRDPQMNTLIFLNGYEDAHFENVDESDYDHPSDYWSVRRQSKYTIPCNTFEYSITIAASIAKFLIDNNYGVGLIASGKPDQILPTERGYRQLGKALDFLAYTQPRSQVSFPIFIESYIKSINRGSTIILITTFAENNLVGSIDIAQARGLKVIMIAIDPVSFGFEGTIDKSILFELEKREIPYYQISYKENIKHVLENGLKTRKLI